MKLRINRLANLVRIILCYPNWAAIYHALSTEMKEFYIKLTIESLARPKRTRKKFLS